MRTRIFGLFLVVGLVTGCGKGGGEADPGTPSEPFRSPLLDEGLARVSARLETRGLLPDGDPWRGFLVQAESAVHDAALPSGECAVFVALASSAVRGLELQLYDVEGTVVARGVADRPHGVVRYCAPQRGLYYVGIRATEGNGLYELRRFRGPRGIELRLDDVFEESPSPVAVP